MDEIEKRMCYLIAMQSNDKFEWGIKNAIEKASLLKNFNEEVFGKK